MEPRVQYAQTADGVSIAFMVAGNGVPVVHPFFYLSHLQLNWANEYSGQWMRALADRYQLIAYDARGNGLSQRGIERYGPDEALYDLEAVIDKLALDRFVILAPLAHGSAPPPTRCARRTPSALRLRTQGPWWRRRTKP